MLYVQAICKCVYIKKNDKETNTIFLHSWSGHVAFPGGKNEASDKHNLDTVIRECKEEIGVDLGTPEFISLGTLKHRMITNMEGKVIMTLVPHGNIKEYVTVCLDTNQVVYQSFYK